MKEKTININETIEEAAIPEEPVGTKESISINNGDSRYEIESIEQDQPNILKIVFTDIIPDQFGDIEVYTPGGTPEDCNLTGYDTVYQADGQTIYLSNDGSVYVEPEFLEDTENSENVLLPEPPSDSE